VLPTEVGRTVHGGQCRPMVSSHWLSAFATNTKIDCRVMQHCALDSAYNSS